MESDFWRGKKVYVTGLAGFKGCWLGMSLLEKGATVKGVSIDAPSDWLFSRVGLDQHVEFSIGDIRDQSLIRQHLAEFQPDIVFHLAAQPLVRRSYSDPIDTISHNVLGTATVLQACREVDSLGALVCVTSDKVYENNEWVYSYRETDALGGADPYSASKACTEIVASSFFRSFFQSNSVGFTTVRAGNVIGGGDWSEDRLIPDFFRSRASNTTLTIRNPASTRPWQHVMEPINGYIKAAEKSFETGLFDSFNFGPKSGAVVSVESLLNEFCQNMDDAPRIEYQESDFHEAGRLGVVSEKALHKLGWSPRWGLTTTVAKTVDGYLALDDEKNPLDFFVSQIKAYERESFDHGA